MKFLLQLGWLSGSMIAMLALIPAWMAVGFFKKNYAVEPTTFVVWYFLGTAIACSLLRKSPIEIFSPSWGITLSILLVGIALGGVANLLSFNAVGIAPNPGMPTAILGVASVGVFVFSILAYNILPNYFEPASMNWQAFAGIIISVGGVALIATAK